MKRPKSHPHILFTAAECAPFAKVGGLADVIGALPQAVAQNGMRASVIIPRYGSIPKTYRLKTVGSLTVRFGGADERVSILRGTLPKNPVTYYFLAHRWFSGPAIYQYRGDTPATGPHQPTDYERFTFFSETVVAAVHELPIDADIIHCNDWHTALVPTFVDAYALTHKARMLPTVYTIHNLGNQGHTPTNVIIRSGLKRDATPSVLEELSPNGHQTFNCMKLGILSADKVTTVSPTYAKEILTKEYGAGLEEFLQRRKRDLTGIVNGIDTDLFNPKTDRSLVTRYDVKSFRKGKAANKKALLKQLNLEGGAPVIGIVSRLVHQKGLDLFADVARALLEKRDCRIIILGTGDPALERQLKELARAYPGRAATRIGFDLSLAQLIYGGSDIFCMPSRFEPCGLGQLIAMRYGTVPVVRETGGLRDTVKNNVTGMTFRPAESGALIRALERALKLYSRSGAWYTMVQRGMKRDVSWNESAAKYQALYQTLL